MEAFHHLAGDIKRLLYIIPTHLHLDHGGGAGLLAKELPEARVVAHLKGARHLMEPSRLIEGTRQAFGAHFEEEFGPILPVPEQRMLVVEGGERLDLGGRELEIVYTPGHASHHICILDDKTRALFCGEALGHYHPEVNFISPSVAMPMFEVELALKSIRTIRELMPELLVFSQYGASRDVDQLVDLAEQQVKVHAEIVLQAVRQGASQAEMEKRLREYDRSLLSKRLGSAIPFARGSKADYGQMVAGLVGYFTEKHMV